MSLSSDLNKHIYVGNGVTKTFDYEFDVLAEDDLHIYLTDTINGTETEITSNYSVSPSEGTFPSSNGTVTYPSIGTAISSDYNLTVLRTLEVLQPTVYPNNTALKPKVVERSFDRITMIAQQQQEQIDRTLQFAITVPDDFSRSLPAPVALKALRINSDATAFEYTTDPEIAANQAAASAAAALTSENNSATNATNAANSASSSAASAAAALESENNTASMLGTKVSKGELIVYAKDHGVIGDGIVDDTAAAQAVLDYGATNKRIVSFGDLIVKISGALTVNGPGLIFSKASYGSSGDCGFYVTGTGYTALTVSPGIKHIACTVYGTGNTANGILLQNNLLSSHGKIRVYNLNGFGLKINKMWDSILPDTSIELCGNATEYAFSMNDDGDTCNMSHILRLQVERSNVKAMYVSPNTLSCVFDNIHTEQTTGDGTTVTHLLKGNACTYNNLRVEGGTNEILEIGSAYGSYNEVRATNKDVHVRYGVSGVPIYVKNLLCGNLTVDDISYETFDNCHITGLTTISYDSSRTVFRTCRIGALTIVGSGSQVSLTDKTIMTGAWNTGTTSCNIDIIDSTVSYLPSLTDAKIKIVGSTVSNAYTTAYNTAVTAYNTIFNGVVTLQNDLARITAYGCTFNDNLSYVTGVAYGCLDSGCKMATGKTVHANWYSDPTRFSYGTKCYNPLPSAGGYIGFVNIAGVTKGFGLVQA